MVSEKKYHILDSEHTDPKRIKAEREKARALKKTQWWQSQLVKGVCYHCQGKFEKSQLTMDHLIPLARGGKSVKGNLVVSCLKCNQEKKLEAPVDALFEQLKKEREGK